MGSREGMERHGSGRRAHEQNFLAAQLFFRGLRNHVDLDMHTSGEEVTRNRLENYCNSNVFNEL